MTFARKSQRWEPEGIQWDKYCRLVVHSLWCQEQEAIHRFLCSG